MESMAPAAVWLGVRPNGSDGHRGELYMKLRPQGGGVSPSSTRANEYLSLTDHAAAKRTALSRESDMTALSIGRLRWPAIAFVYRRDVGPWRNPSAGT